MRLFISAGEPSGDLHGASLIHCLRERVPNLDVVGFGGDRMAAAGCRLIYPLCDHHAVVGVGQALRSISSFARILGMARESFRAERPDALVMIDYPGFHWWLAGAARQEGIPVSYFVPPQIWAWAPWRAKKMRRLCDQVLCSLPFEEPWLQQRGIPARYIGHPYFDELAGQHLDIGFLNEQRARPGTVVALLPGSRSYELQRNVPVLNRAAELVHERRPDVRFLVACLKPQQAEYVRATIGATHLPIEIHHGRTPEIIELAHSCMAVSGSVSLELLYRGKPAAIVYRIHWAMRLVGFAVLRAKYITLVNLLADKLLFPEYVTVRCVAHQLAGHVLHWLQEPEAYKQLCAELAALKQAVAEPGACGRAATAILELVRGQEVRRAA
jgi:lipid-A-disaccharide synthase